jgi:DNA polymerase-3 subunit delta'
VFEDFEDSLEENLNQEELKPPRETTEWLGDGSIEQEILGFIQNNRMPHALIFAGPEGIGKQTMAFRLARYLLSGKHSGLDQTESLFTDEMAPKENDESLYVPNDDPVFKKVASGGHPDLLTIEKKLDEKTNVYKDSVVIEDIRKVTPFLRLTASVDNGWRIVIVNDADTMTRNAQNALLKILEEPPENTLLILVTHKPGMLLPTIRSRSHVVNFRVLDKENFSSLLSLSSPELSTEDINILYELSGGSAGKGIRLEEDGGVKTITKVIELIQTWPDWDWENIYNFAESTLRKSDKNAFITFKEVFLWSIESILRSKAKATALPSILNNEHISSMLSYYTLNNWIEIYEKANKNFQSFDQSNLDKRQIIIMSFMLLEKQKAAA